MAQLKLFIGTQKQMLIGMLACGLLLSGGASFAQCRPAGEQVELSGKFMRTETVDFLIPDTPVVCVAGEKERQAERVTLHFANGRPAEDEIADNSEVLVDGVFSASGPQDGVLFEAADIVLLAEDDASEAPLTSAQKAVMLEAFARFQRAVHDRDAVSLKHYFSFPLDGIAAPFFGDDVETLSAEAAAGPLTEALFVRYQDTILNVLQPVARIGVDMARQEFSEYRINSLSSKEQARRYTETEEGSGVWYYVEESKRYELEGVCDKVSTATLSDSALIVTIGMDSNLTLPGRPEECELQDIFFFRLAGDEIKLVNAASAG